MSVAVGELHLLPGLELPEDIRQEMAISHLTGKKASMRRLQGPKDLGYGLRPASDAIPVWSIVHRPDFTTLEKLTEFILDQEESIKREILAYLVEPNESQLSVIIKALGIEQRPAPQKPPITLTDLILKALPATLDELYALARVAHQSRKPEAAVRQNVRNLIRRERIAWEGERLCRAGGSANRTKRSFKNQGRS